MDIFAGKKRDKTEDVRLWRSVNDTVGFYFEKLPINDKDKFFWEMVDRGRMLKIFNFCLEVEGISTQMENKILKWIEEHSGVEQR